MRALSIEGRCCRQLRSACAGRVLAGLLVSLLLANGGCGGTTDPATKGGSDTQLTDTGSDSAVAATDAVDPSGSDTAATDGPLDVADGSNPADASDVTPGQTGSVSVVVRNAVGLPIADATLQMAGGPKTTTDIAGKAVLSGVPAGKMTLLVSAKGYADAAGQVVVQSGATSDLWLALASIDQVVILDPSQPIQTKTAAVAVSANAAAFVFASGAPVVGELQLAIAAIDPSTAALNTAPGPLKEVKADGSAGATLAAMAITDLTFRASGQPVQLKPGAKASVSMTIPTALTSGLSAGDTLGAYWFDPAAAAWRSGAQATVSKDVFGNLAADFQADHFTWWMVAKPIAGAGCFAVTVTLDGKPAVGADLYASSWSAGALSKAAADAGGKACLEGVVGAAAQVGAKVGELTAVVEAPAPAAGTCGGSCTPVTIALQSGQACVQYAISGSSAAGGKLVWATDKGAAGAISLTGSNGCLPVPADAQVTLVASNGALYSPPQKVSGLVPASCGGACASVNLAIPPKPEAVAGGDCSAAPDGAPCDDNNACTLGDQCWGGGCAGAPKPCNDGDLCTQNDCDAASGKCNFQKIAGCLVGEGCQLGSAAQCAGACAIAGPAIAAAAADALAACLTSACPSADAACKSAALTGSCAQANAVCTAADSDKDGQPDLADCAPTDPSVSGLITESCDGKDNDCDGSTDEAGAGCPTGQNCAKAQCVPASSDNGCSSDLACDDGKTCTADFCVNYACAHAPVPGCNSCSSAADCPALADACKAWTCAPGNLCVVKALPGTSCTGACTGSAECEDGDACTGNYCVAGLCKSLPAANCGGGNNCQAILECLGQCLEQPSPSLSKCVGQCAGGQSAEAQAAVAPVVSCLTTTCPSDSDIACMMNASDSVCKPQFAACKGPPACLSDAECDDGDKCTSDVCNGDGCAHWSSSGDPACQGSSSCQSDANCPGAAPCQQAICQGGTCYNVPDPSQPGCGSGCQSDADCEDNNPCTLNSCMGGTCNAMPNPDPNCGGPSCLTDADCEDNNPCTLNSCLGGKCSAMPSPDPSCGGQGCQSDGQCEDGNPCTVGKCLGGQCSQMPSPAPECNGGCQDDYQCEDGDPCTINHCKAGTCTSAPAQTVECVPCTSAESCNDLNPCTIDTCLATKCVSSKTTVGQGCGSCQENVEGACDDKEACTLDYCQEGSCQHLVPQENPACEPPCAIDADCAKYAGKCKVGSCVAGKCAYKLDEVNCCDADADCPDDDNPCTKAACFGYECGQSPVAGCGPCGTDAECNDYDNCTTDTCSAGSCEHVNNGGAPGCCKSNSDCPDDSNACTIELCGFGYCNTQQKIGCGPCTQDYECGDYDDCTTDSCEAGFCAHTSICPSCETHADCGGFNLCTACSPAGQCQVATTGVPMGVCADFCQKDAQCDDTDPCTTQVCDKSTSKCVVKATESCSQPTCASAASCLNTCVDGGNGLTFCAAKCWPQSGADKQSFAAVVSCLQDPAKTTADCGAELAACAGTCSVDAECPVPYGCATATCNAGACTYQPLATCLSCKDTTALCPQDLTGCTAAACTAGVCTSKVLSAPIPNGCEPCVVVEDCSKELCIIKTCDDGKCNWTYSSGPCDDGNECTGQDSCYGPKCEGIAGAVASAACDDGDLCSAASYCDYMGNCAATALTCDDANGCTLDVCDPATGGCSHTNSDAACEDGEPCTAGDSCSGGSCIAGSPKSCEDDDVCTVDEKCLPGMGCVFNNLSCPADNDGNICTDQQCVSGTGCTTVFLEAFVPCDNLEAPCALSTCGAFGVCTPTGEVIPCAEDGNACTQHTCEIDAWFGTKKCVQKAYATTTACDDNDPCTGNDTCAGTICVGGPSPCDDNNPCTDDSCNATSGACTHTNNLLPCADDGNLCTADMCAAGSCTHPANSVPCADDGNTCTSDVCAAGSCSHPNLTGTPCEEGNVCTEDTCSDGACIAGPPKDGPCDDGEPCTANDSCAAGSCVGGGDTNCNDQNDCTADSCQDGVGCKHTPKSNAEYCDKGCKIEPGSSCKDCGGYNCFGELLGGHYCGNPAGSNAGICQP